VIFAIIDLLEKILHWLKKFAPKEDKFQAESGEHGDDSLVDAPAGEKPKAQDVESMLQGVLPKRRRKLVHSDGELPIITDFINLYNDDSRNKNPTTIGRIFAKGSEDLIFSKKADPAVWHSLRLRWSQQYTIIFDEA
jgi:hypothetical protein